MTLLTSYLCLQKKQKPHPSTDPLFTTMAHGFFNLVEGEGRRGEGPSKPP